MGLNAGSVASFANGMAEAMEISLQEEWLATKGVVLPQGGIEDRKLLFVAIARGVLRYLEDHENELITSITLESGGIETSHTVSQLNLNIDS